MTLRSIMEFINLNTTPVIVKYREDELNWAAFAYGYDASSLYKLLDKEIRKITVKNKYTPVDDALVPHIIITLK